VSPLDSYLPSNAPASPRRTASGLSRTRVRCVMAGAYRGDRRDIAVSTAAVAILEPMPQVVVVEDDEPIRTALARSLRERGHVVTAIGRGMDAIRTIVDEAPDVVVLDLGLPDLDGADVLAMVRAVTQVPIIIATARDDEREVVRLLHLGADDYVVKPFGGAQIDARITAVLRRSATRSTEDQSVRVGGLVIDPPSRSAELDGRQLELTRKEFDMLLALTRRAGEVVSKRELLADVWQLAWGGGDRTVDVHLSWLRRKLGETAAAPRYLHSVRGVGIRLDPPTDAP
jgi:DNA-binding response OmpR family regulator